MPSRWAALVILVYWSIAAFCLLTWDVLPELTVGYPPDLRAIAFAGASPRPVIWTIQVVDDPRSAAGRRTVGRAVTRLVKQSDGWSEMSSQAEFDARELLQGTPLATRTSLRLKISSRYQVGPSGNLNAFDLRVTSRDLGDELVAVQGRLHGKLMKVTTHGPIEILNREMSFEYEPRSVVQDALGPLDRLPGLQVGQRWESRVINPFSGKVDSVRARVARRTMFEWDGNLVPAFEVEQRMSPLTARTWVRTDGVVLRQEVPFPFVRIVLDRQPALNADGPEAAPRFAPLQGGGAGRKAQ